MAGTGPGDLHALAEELLAAGAEALDTVPDFLGTSFAGAPDRQFISPGQPVADCCEMLTTWIASIGEGARSRQLFTADFRINRPQLHLLVLRCVPSGTVEGKTYIPPTPESLTLAAEQIHADGWAIWNHLFEMARHEPESLLFEKCSDFLWSPAQIQSPAGGCAGWQFTVFPGVEGYPEDLST